MKGDEMQNPTKEVSMRKVMAADRHRAVRAMDERDAEGRALQYRWRRRPMGKLKLRRRRRQCPCEGLKTRPGQAIVVFGGVETVQKLVAAGLVDEFWLKVNPVATGRGGALLDSGIPAMELELKTARGYPSGKVALIYQNANRS
jgi:hypothetical protein